MYEFFAIGSVDSPAVFHAQFSTLKLIIELEVFQVAGDNRMLGWHSRVP